MEKKKLNLLERIADRYPMQVMALTMFSIIPNMNLFSYGITKYELNNEPISNVYAKLSEYKNYELAKIMTFGMYVAAKERLDEIKNNK